MRKILVRTGVGLAAVALAVCVPAIVPSSSADPGDPMTIQRLDVDYALAADGTLQATETIQVQNPAADRHGIYRYFAHGDPTAPRLRRVPQALTGHRVGDPAGAPTSDTLLTTPDRGRTTSLRLGSPDAVLPQGTSTYAVTYRLDDVLLPAGGASRWVWDIVPPGWTMPVAEAHLTVHLPSTADDATCAVGGPRIGTCDVTGAGTQTLEITATGLPARTPVTVRAGLAGPAPALHAAPVPWSVRWDPVHGGSRRTGLTILAATLGALLLGAALTTATRRREPAPHPLRLTPPAGLGPVQARFMLTGQVPPDALTVAFVQAAARGAVTLTCAPHSWSVDPVPGAAPRDLDAVTAAAVRGLHRDTLEVAASPESSAELRRRTDAVHDALTRWAAGSGYVRAADWVVAARVLWVAAAAAAVVLAVAGLFANPFGPTAWALVPALFAAAAVGVWTPGARSRLTPAGRAVAADVVGFRENLRTRQPAPAPTDPSRAPVPVGEALPWAFGLGVLDEWAKGVPDARPAYVRGPGTASPLWVHDLRSTYLGAVLLQWTVTGLASATTLGGAAAYGAASSAGGFGAGGGSVGGDGGGGGGGGGSW